ncbi:hypothetical protein RchiOBHm_Chr6g0263481 [Rosa chinensis]|uniref:Uncharacterized protein n=1 Tax=Rosa chinensis TaxID=74649 RepID=A0A2P6PNY6_ROSCH|nr:hypothetical protein RchiOBHm_Chr6g0263481 [Rosa chinensis]
MVDGSAPSRRKIKCNDENKVLYVYSLYKVVLDICLPFVGFLFFPLLVTRETVFQKLEIIVVMK